MTCPKCGEAVMKQRAGERTTYWHCGVCGLTLDNSPEKLPWFWRAYVWMVEHVLKPRGRDR